MKKMFLGLAVLALGAGLTATSEAAPVSASMAVAGSHNDALVQVAHRKHHRHRRLAHHRRARGVVVVR